MPLSLNKRLFIFFPTLFCFCLPFGFSVLSIIIALWFLTSFFNGNQRNIKEGVKNNAFIWSVLFFLITCISAVLSSNHSDAVSAIEIKISFVVLPYLLFCFNWPVDVLKRFVVAFVSGCLFACIYLIVRATIYAVNGHPEYYFYTSFSDFIHASYFAMYLVLAIIFILVFYPTWYKAQKNILYSAYGFLVVFILTVFLCSSKLGILSLFICLPVTVLVKSGIKLNFRTILFSVLLLAATLFIAARLFPTPFNRINTMLSVSNKQIDKTSSESTAVRLLIWEQCFSLAKQHWLMGVGVGDANTRLYEAYVKNGLTGAYEHRLNAHNQYLQTSVGMGLIGLVTLFMLTCWQLIQAFRRSNFTGLMFFVIIVLNFFVESMLQTAAGVLFFTFFYCFFNLVTERQLQGE